jgi:hypothetical protein
VKKEDSAAEPCTRSPVQTAALKPKSRSSQLKAVRYIAEAVSRNTDDTRFEAEAVVPVSFPFDLLFL